MCGAKMNNRKLGMDEESWYALVKEAFATLGQEEAGRLVMGCHPVEGRDPATSVCESAKSLSPLPAATGSRVRSSTPLAGKRGVGHGMTAAYPLLGAAPVETTPARPLSPSKLDGDAPPADSPLVDITAVERGSAIHRILQHAPQIPDARAREQLALTLAKTHAPHVAQAQQEQLVAEALSIITNAEYAPLFSKDSLAEVPISGMVNWQGERVAIVGQMDRLVVLEKEVWIVDYKSNARPSAQVPESYQRQLALYAALLAEIYPQHAIRAWLLWTAIPRLDEVVTNPADAKRSAGSHVL